MSCSQNQSPETGLEESMMELGLEDTREDVDWCPTPKSNNDLGALNKFLRSCSRSVSPVRGQLGTPLEKTLSSTSRYYKRKAKHAVHAALNSIAPGQAEMLLKEITCCDVEPMGDDEMFQRLLLLYNNAETWYVRRQILSTFVGDYTKKQLLESIPGLTVYKIDQARKHAHEYGAGLTVHVEPMKRDRLIKTRVDHFLDSESQELKLLRFPTWSERLLPLGL